MGGKKSKLRTSHHSFVHHGPSSRPVSSPNPGNQVKPDSRSLSRSRYAKIGDNFSSLDEVTAALFEAGLESSNLIVGVDFTKSNEWTGARSFNNRCLHYLGDSPNPYELAMFIIGRTLSAFDEDDLIPCFGFGDASTHDQAVFSFYSDGRPCNGFHETLMRYREIVPELGLAGPTSFAPIIEKAIGIVERSGGQFHVLLIIADGQVTRSVDTRRDQLSPQEKATINAIVKGSDYPLSIVMVGVGDEPWDMMRQFDDKFPSRTFDNFQFVNFTDIMSRNIPTAKKEATFALAALMKIPLQYRATLELQLLGCMRGTSGENTLPPTDREHKLANINSKNSLSSLIQKDSDFDHVASAPPEHLIHKSEACPMCFLPCRDLVFGCGHQTCYDCGRTLLSCPICQSHITTRIRLCD